MIADPAVTSIRLVLTPDALALEEAKKAYGHMCLYGLNADEVYLNEVLPDFVKDHFFVERRKLQDDIRHQATEAFKPLPLREVPLQATPPTGLDALGALADAVWPTGDPAARQSNDRAINVAEVDGQVLVDIKLPFATAKDVDLAKFENELYITLGNHRRTLLLPKSAAEMQPIKAKFSEGRLLVTLARTS
jgi:arsenite-transporting ATPase